MIHGFAYTKAKAEVSGYLAQMSEYLDYTLYVHMFPDNPEHWMLISSKAGKLTEGDPEHVVRRIEQIAKEHGLDWMIDTKLDPDSWWP